MSGLNLKVGGIYRAKRPALAGWNSANDRQILHISPTHVQYDSPSVKNGRKYPKVTIEAFLKWADTEITLPVGEWDSWPASKAVQK